MDTLKAEKKVFAISLSATRIHCGKRAVGCESIVQYTTRAEAEFIAEKRLYSQFPKFDGWTCQGYAIAVLPLKVYEGFALE